MPFLAPSFTTLRVLPRFASALGDSSGAWSADDHKALRLGFHAIRALQQRMHDGALDEAFRLPLLEAFGHGDEDAPPSSLSRVSKRTRDAARYLAKCLLVGDSLEVIVDAFNDFANRLRIDDLHGLALDAFLTLADITGSVNDERAIECRCVAGVLAMSANEWDTFDVILSDLRQSRSRTAQGCAWNLEARRAFVRGNLPAAERAARTAVTLIDASKPSTVASLSHHTLGIVVGSLGRHGEATSVLFEAYRLAPDPYRAQWALGCLAVGFLYLGRFDAAEDCCALLGEAENANVRALAYTTSLRIALRRGDWAELAVLRSKCEALLERRILIAHASANLCYVLGAALQHMGDLEGARSFWDRGFDVARTHGMNHAAYLIDVALNTGRVGADALGPVPPREEGAAGATGSYSELADLEQRLRAERAAYELAVTG